MTIPDHKPKMCNLSITLGCTLKCKMCFHWQCDERTLTRPTINQWKHFLGSLHGKVNPDFTVVFGGGEPLLFPGELLELISFCTRLRFRTVLATSGYTMTHDYARRLAAAGLDIISITLFSIDDRIHDNIRGITGAHQHAMHALDVLSLQNPKMHIAINSIIMKLSLGELLLLADWVNKDKRFPGINFQAVMKPFHTPPIDNWYQTEPYRDLWPDNITEIEDVIDGLIQRKKGGNRISNPVSQLELFKSFFKQT